MTTGKIVQIQVSKDSVLYPDGKQEKVRMIYALDDTGEIWVCSIRNGKQQPWIALKSPVEGGGVIPQGF